VRQGQVCLLSTLDVNGEELTKSIVDHLSVSAKEAIEIKNKDGLIRNRENKELFNSIMNTVLTLKEEIQKHYRYWHTRVDDRGGRVSRIDKIILCGGNANFAGLQEYLSGSLGVRVERGNVWINAFSFNDFIPEINRHESLSYATAVGLALRDIN
jgi:Tfp pilus assembly PilM family ATPase